jgi:cryptochrome
LKDLEKQFAKHGIPFMCFYGEADKVLETLIKEWDIRFLSFEKDSESIWRKRDNAVKELCARSNVQVIERATHTLYDPDEIFNINNDMAVNTCGELKQFCLRLGDPQQPEPNPDLKFFQNNLRSAMSLYDANVHRVPELDRFNIVPECKEQEVCLFEGGETKALQLFRARLGYEKECFKDGGVNPNLSKPILFSKEISLSPYLRFGCLSVRKFYWDIKQIYTEVNFSFDPYFIY